MPKRKAPPETRESQGERFKREAEKLIAAGELTAIDGEDGIERVLENAKLDEPRKKE